MFSLSLIRMVVVASINSYHHQKKNSDSISHGTVSFCCCGPYTYTHKLEREKKTQVDDI